MKWMWCWRCKQEMPMLDENEFAEIARLFTGGIKAIKEFRLAHGVPLKNASMDERFEPVRVAYECITGARVQNENAIMHHRISLYGPPCKQCHKPPRTPKARLCGACMYPVKINES